MNPIKADGRIGPHTAMGDALRTVKVFKRLLSAYVKQTVIDAIMGAP